MFDGQDGFPFVIGGSMASVTELHPPAVQIFQLWQIYLDNVNPLLKLTHTPTLQGQLIEAAANPSKTSKPLEALLFSIYFMAVISLTDDEVQETFKEDKTRLMARYHRGTQQALVNAGFMRSPDIVVLQAFLMYLVSLDPANIPISVTASTSFKCLTISDCCSPICRSACSVLFDRNCCSGCQPARTASRCRKVSIPTF